MKNIKDVYITDLLNEYEEIIMWFADKTNNETMPMYADVRRIKMDRFLEIRMEIVSRDSSLKTIKSVLGV